MDRTPIRYLYKRQEVDSPTPVGPMQDPSHIMSSVAVPIILTLAGMLAVKLWIAPSKPYPPGPRPLPFIGNVLDVPQQYQWRRFCEWKGRYGVPHIPLSSFTSC